MEMEVGRWKMGRMRGVEGGRLVPSPYGSVSFNIGDRHHQFAAHRHIITPWASKGLNGSVAWRYDI